MRQGTGRLELLWVITGDIDITLLCDRSILSEMEILKIWKSVKWMFVGAGNGVRQNSLLVESTGWV